ncbi:Mitochondrial import receptor subunit TOM70 [Homalodisca vitripennis]|nr:Mitochondrial import receptor subunit TOM70 [Homalodisca vitripennis]
MCDGGLWYEPPLQRAQLIKDAGNVFFKEGKYTDAIRCYTEAIDLCPSSETNILSTFYQNRAACHDQLNNLDGTVKDCTKALELNPKYTKALTRRAKAYQSLGKLSDCLEDVTSVCILESFQNQKSLEMADTVLKGLGMLFK